MRSLSTLFLLGLFCLQPSITRASQIFVEPATGSGVSGSDLDTATQLIKNAISDVSSNQVVDSKDHADFRLRPNLMRLGEAYEL